MRLAPERLVSPAREGRVALALPPIETAENMIAATSTLVRAVADGALAPSEATALKPVANVAQAIEVAENNIGAYLQRGRSGRLAAQSP